MLTALVCVAARTGSPKTKGENAEVSLAGDGGRPPSLHLKAYHGECDALATELKRTQAVAVNQPDQKGISALQIAVARGHLCAVEALLESGANPRQVVEEDGRTLLDFAEHAARQQGASAAVMQIKQVLEAAVREERWLAGDAMDGSDEVKERTYRVSSVTQTSVPGAPPPQDIKWHASPPPSTGAGSGDSLAESLIEKADRSGDGMLSLEELEDFGDSSDENPFDPELMMAKADANGDRQLSFREIDDYVAEVMQSEMMRQAVPGNFGASMASEAKTEL